MRQTWRWFGPKDLCSIDDIRQADVEGVVSALHHVPTGAVWTPEEIARRQTEIATMTDGAPSTLTWDVVESLPVSEDIKRQSGEWRDHIANWKTSMRHLRAAGIEVICYNFMPILDWTRTDLAYRLPSGATCMRFDAIDFAAFDLFILERAGAMEGYEPELVETARERFSSMSDTRRCELAGNVVFGLPGSAEAMSMEDVKAHLARYDNISPSTLRQHLVDFLAEVSPLAEEIGMRLCCHPDDPPFPLLGLPRIMSTEADYRAVMEAVDIPANGITLCTGSLGARADNNLPDMMDRLGSRVHFLHLRNVALEARHLGGSFHEAAHLEGNTDMVAMIAAILAEEGRRKTAGRADWNIPFRPDHGQNILDDLNRGGQPGYPSIGRLKGLAELRGIMIALSHPLPRARQ
ncbi:mannonate dehydratase [Ancylobacter defluvii]|uniref:Mannonate dehydratase n=1 Tax=Ancylobacter defluvii TaxID=1282440 RepID=A0A9W6N8Y9_9HYPH|nr:mannonate dehydratase [Ancylobacter defluvii]MBS7590239.1 mannonate dehydratase [Ancylobacter defluvii]GLK82884.1 mannonate dehydratase [Ancylobacter defluvii]